MRTTRKQCRRCSCVCRFRLARTLISQRPMNRHHRGRVHDCVAAITAGRTRLARFSCVRMDCFLRLRARRLRAIHDLKLAPFILILSPTFYLWLTVTSTLFLFFFYNITAHGLPCCLAVSWNGVNTLWITWSLWPWAVLIVGMLLLWRKAVTVDPALRLFSLKTLPAEPRE